jgi:putative MATE family efflux protein
MLRHVIVMASTGAIGLIAVFAVDLINLLYISLLGQREIAAAVGFAGTVGFFQTALSIGMTIGIGATVSRAIGAGLAGQARRVATSSLLIMVLLGVVAGGATVGFVQPILGLLGAAGRTRALAAGYLSITSLSLPLLALGMAGSALLRSAGDARQAMNVTLAAAFATAVLDPLLIFALHLGLTGAAISTLLSRCVLAGLALSGARGHRLLAAVRLDHLPADGRRILQVAVPAILTNLATPVGAAFVTRSMAQFGSAAVAGQATVDRITPVAFGIVYALTGAIGPIIAQNLGAGRIARIREALRDSLLVTLVAVCVAWALLALGQDLVVRAFSATGTTAALIHLFCRWTAGGFLFSGALFVGNAAFNNLGRPLLATLFNWGRATLGTIPFVAFGASYGPQGVMIGQALGSVAFGLGAAATAFFITGRLARPGPHAPVAQAGLPGASGQAALAALQRHPDGS